MNSVIVLIPLLFISWVVSALLHKNVYFAYKDKDHNAHKIIFFSLPALAFGFIFIALKPFTAGADTYAYLTSFSKINNPLTAAVAADYGPELLFWPLQSIIKFFVNARGWYIVHFFIVSSLYYFSYKKITEHTRITALIFPLIFLTYFIAYGANAMRQVYSIPLGVIAFHYAYNKNYLKYLFFSILSILFHWSAFVILIAPAILKIKSRTILYIFLPIGALVSSLLMVQVTNLLASLIGFDWLAIKINAYVNGVRISHISEIWTTLNFWFCVAIYTLLVYFKITKDQCYDKIIKYIFLFFCLMLFSINNADISDRYMVHFLFISPLAIVLIIDRLRIGNLVKNIMTIAVFCTMATLVYTRESLMFALGLH